ncbi:DNA ligase [Thalassotalea fusca]
MTLNIMLLLLLLGQKPISSQPNSLSTPPPIQLATTPREINHIEHYWVSEKLDGMRAYWDGKSLYTRQGNPIFTPEWFIKNWPKTPMDGELWSQRNHFERIISCVRRKLIEPLCWRRLAFYVFDIPTSDKVFGQRIEHMKGLVEHASNPHLKMIEQFRVADNDSLYALLDFVVSHGGEGLMLHHEHARYHVGRSQHLLKLKPYQDAEAVVVKHIQGRGKYTGLLGAMLVRTPEGIEFKIGSGFSDQQRSEPPPIGAIITYKYVGKTARGVPRFASFLRIRQYKH